MASDQMTAKLLQRSLTIALLGMLSACGGGSYLERPRESLSVVVDAGSSGSRIYLYKTTPDDSFIQIRQLFTNKDAPHGLSWFDGTQGAGSAPGNAGQSGIQPLLSALKTYMDRNGIRQDQVSVSVLATAGMRLVDADTASAIYQSVKSTITGNGFAIRQVGTLSGQNEGLYAWADVNYLAGNFKAGAATQGLVEVGGASSQVAFVTSSSQDPNVVIPMVNGVRYPVFSISYLGLGQNQARLAMINDSASGGVNANVCYPNNTTGSPPTYDADTGNTSISATGSNYSAACYGVYAKVITSVSAGAGNNYPVTQMSSLGGFNTTQFLGLSSTYNVLKDWGALDTANPQQSLEETVASKCIGSNAWPRVLAQYKNIPSVFSQNACANATYLNAFVYGQQSLGIHPARLSGTGTINGSELTWTRGFLVIDPAP
jgi:hypothetical protein